jgi:hypothetical protein
MPTDQERLQTFIDRVRVILSELVGAQNDLLRPVMRPLFTDAWAEVVETVPRVRAAVGSLSDDQLRTLGLSGAQLTLKLEGFRLADQALTLGGWTDDIVKKVLDWINILLGSILAGVPGAEPLKELKESLEKELESKS